VVGGKEFLRERDSREYALLAKIRSLDGGHPLFLIFGQTGITNRAGASYLRENFRAISSAHGAGENWCVVLCVVAPSVYGHEMTELAADVSSTAFAASPQPSVGPACLGRGRGQLAAEHLTEHVLVQPVAQAAGVHQRVVHVPQHEPVHARVPMLG
jgi:hypothetical protein